jgi:hypothetical protein
VSLLGKYGDFTKEYWRFAPGSVMYIGGHWVVLVSVQNLAKLNIFAGEIAMFPIFLVWAYWTIAIPIATKIYYIFIPSGVISIFLTWQGEVNLLKLLTKKSLHNNQIKLAQAARQNCSLNPGLGSSLGCCPNSRNRRNESQL